LSINARGNDIDITSPPLDGIGSDVAIFIGDSDNELTIDINIAAIACAATSIGGDFAIVAL
jgi:hypothetical protein